MGERDAVHLAHDQVGVVPQDGAADLAADDGRFDQHLRVVPPGGLHRGRQVFRAAHLADAEGRPRTGRLHEDGIREPAGIDGLVSCHGPEIRRGDPRAPGDDVRKGFVHAQGGALDVAAHVRNAGELQQPLRRTVLTEGAVQDGKDDVQADRPVLPLLQDEQPVHAPVR